MRRNIKHKNRLNELDNLNNDYYKNHPNFIHIEWNVFCWLEIEYLQGVYVLTKKSMSNFLIESRELALQQCSKTSYTLQSYMQLRLS